MTTPRPPRPGGPRRTPKVAGRAPARPSAPETPAVEEPTKKSRSRFTRAPKQPETSAVAPPAVETPAVETPAVETPAVAPEAAATDVVETGDAPVTAVESSDAPTTATAAPADETPTTSLTKQSPAETADGPRGKNRPTTKVSTIKPQSNRPSAPPPVSAAASTASARRPLFGWRFVGIVTAAAVVFAVVAGIAALRPGVSLGSNVAFVNSALTSEVTSQANARICSIFAVNYGDVETWQKKASLDLTGRAATEFKTSLPGLRKAVVDLGLTSGGVDCKIDTVGVKSIDGDTAILIANVLVSETQNQQAAGSGSTRYQVTMQRVNGKWLISNFEKF